MKLAYCEPCNTLNAADTCVTCGKDPYQVLDYNMRTRVDYNSCAKPPKNAERGWMLARRNGMSFYGRWSVNHVGITRTVSGQMHECRWGLHWSDTIVEARRWCWFGATLYRVVAWGGTQRGEGKNWSHHRLPVAQLNFHGLVDMLGIHGKITPNDWDRIENLALELVGE